MTEQDPTERVPTERVPAESGTPPADVAPAAELLSAPPVGAPPVGWNAAVPTGPRGNRRLVVIVGLIAVLIVAAVAGLIVAGSSIGQQIGTDPAFVFGTTVMQRLDPAARDRVVARYKAVLGDRFKGMTETEASDASAKLTQKGYLRLDDQHHVRRLQLLAAAFGASDVASCASVARASFTGATPDQTAVIKVISSLDSAGLEEWLNQSFDAEAAEIAGAPPARSVTAAQFQDAFQRLAATMPSAEYQTFQKVAQGAATATDADVCAAYRTLYRAASAAPQADAVVFSIYDLGGGGS